MANSFLFPVDPPSAADTGDEISIQSRLRVRLRHIAPGVRLVAIPNAGKRTAWAAMQAKREGMSKGFPDLMVCWDGGIAFLEIKQRTGSLGTEQISWLNWLHAGGFACGCFRSVDTAIEFLRRQGAPILAQAA